MDEKIIEGLSSKVNNLALLLKIDNSISDEIIDKLHRLGFDLTKDKMDLIQYLGIIGNNTITQIKKRSKSHTYSYLSKMISELEEKGLLSKLIKASNKREKYIKLTSKGKEVSQIINDYHLVNRVNNIRDIVNRLDKREVNAVNKFLDYSIERFNRGY